MTHEIENAIADSLQSRAATVWARPAPLERIQSRAAQLQRRRRKHRLAVGITAAVTAVAVAAAGVAAEHSASRSQIVVGSPPSASVAGRSLQDLADTTKGHTCGSLGAAEPTPPTTIAVGMKASPLQAQVLVPTSMALGYCAADPSTILPFQVSLPFTVLANCTRCDRPSAAVAISRSSDRDTWTAQTSTGEQTGVLDGKTYGYKPPSSPGGRAQLAWPRSVSVGQGPTAGFLLVGHGLTKAQYLELATRLALSQPPVLVGLRTVYEGSADAFDNMSRAVDADFSVSWVSQDGRRMVTFSYQHTLTPPSLSAFGWEYAHAEATSSNRGVILSAADPEGAGRADNYLLVTPDAVIEVQYVSAATGPAPAFPISILSHLQSVSTASAGWLGFVKAASRHTIALKPGVASPPTGSFAYSIP